MSWLICAGLIRLFISLQKETSLNCVKLFADYVFWISADYPNIVYSRLNTQPKIKNLQIHNFFKDLLKDIIKMGRFDARNVKFVREYLILEERILREKSKMLWILFSRIVIISLVVVVIRKSILNAALKGEMLYIDALLVIFGLAWVYFGFFIFRRHLPVSFLIDKKLTLAGKAWTRSLILGDFNREAMITFNLCDLTKSEIKSGRTLKEEKVKRILNWVEDRQFYSKQRIEKLLELSSIFELVSFGGAALLWLVVPILNVF